MARIFIYQIYYDAASRAALDSGFLPLDNSANERPDWREYHPIRNALLNTTLEDGAFYGFLSPRFRSKTQLSAEQVMRFVEQNQEADAVLFSPFFDQSAFYRNVFEQGEVYHSGLIALSQEFVASAGLKVDLAKLVTDATNTVFSNYFVARAGFWRAWLALGEQLFAHAESSAPIAAALRSPTLYSGGYSVEFKVFIMERLATLLLATGRFRTATYDPTKIPPGAPEFARFGREALLCDALKTAYRAHGLQAYLDQFHAIRNWVFSSMRSPTPAASRPPGRL